MMSSNSALGKYASYAWVSKILSHDVPGKLVCWYSTGWQNHFYMDWVSNRVRNTMGENGQLALIMNQLTFLQRIFGTACFSMFW